MTVKFTNNASTTVGTGINASATSLTVASASSFPSLSGADDYCYLTLQGATNTTREVVKATALSGNTFTIVRAQDNTSAASWVAGDIVELRMTAALLTDVIDAATVEGVKTNYQYTPTAGQTVFSGADNASATMIINQAALVSVYMNGVRLVQGTDYSVSSANNTVTLGIGATTADIIDIEVYGNFVGQSGAAVGITGGSITGTAITATTLGATGTATLNTLVSNNATISGGSLDGVTIGGTTRGAISGNAISGTSFASTGNMTFGDNDKAIFGAGSDLQIYHNGSNSIITETGTGNLYLGGDNLLLTNGSLSAAYLEAITGGAVNIYHNGSTKLATTSTGIDVTGTVTADGLTVDGGSTTEIKVFSQGRVSPTTLSEGASGAELMVGSSNPLTLGTASTDRLNIASNGDISFYEDTGTTPKLVWKSADERLGIGTSSPTDNLDISLNNNTGGLVGVQIHNTNTGTVANFAGMYTTAVNGTVGMRVQAASIAGLSAATFGSTTSHPVRFVTADVERMHIDSSGNVGIGCTPSPWFGSKALEFGFYGSISADSVGSKFGTNIAQNAYASSEGAEPSPWKYITSSTNARPSLYQQYDGGHYFSTAATGTAGTAISWSESMRIDSSGNVGIGVTPNASARLHIGKSGASPELWLERTDGYLPTKLIGNTLGNGQGFKINVAGTDALAIDSSGNVGIGTSSPTSYASNCLHLNAASTSISLRLTNSTTGSTVSDGSDIEVDGSNLNIVNRESGNIALYTSATERMRISSGGTVGIGMTPVDTNNATYRLQLYASSQCFMSFQNDTTGTGNDQGLVIGCDSAGADIYQREAQPLRFHTSNTERMRLDASGNFIVGGITAQASDAVTLLPDGEVTAAGFYFSNNIGAAMNDTGIRRATTSTMVFDTASTERMRLDASGSLLVGTTDASIWDNTTGNGINLRGDLGLIASARTNAEPLMINRMGTDGEIIKLNKDGTTEGSLSVASNVLKIFATSSANCGIGFFSNSTVRPLNNSGALSDNAIDLGDSGTRWDDIYATNGTIQTSDRNEKQDIEELSDAEQRVAVAAKGLLRKFRWKSSVAEKGDEARTHFGIIAQDLQAAFAAEGLDAGDYAMFINSTWTDEETGEERSRMGVRYSELLAFIIAAI